MAQGRGNANRGLEVGLAILCVLALAQTAFSATYTVGGSSGWTYNAINWPRGKTFRAGDVLVFKYNRSLHNVVKVSGTGYNACTTGGARAYQTGQDVFKLTRGTHYFICSLPGHCKSNMKIAVKVY
ncbi:hypothetical protein RND81_03G069100 [Saponaria officinalis]|uniref:Basic blue protein n=1 Tax=Saponaria officinalis TaxID=3572 RepID=A0AAW1LZ27_SAPOF